MAPTSLGLMGVDTMRAQSCTNLSGVLICGAASTSPWVAPGDTPKVRHPTYTSPCPARPSVPHCRPVGQTTLISINKCIKISTQHAGKKKEHCKAGTSPRFSCRGSGVSKVALNEVPPTLTSVRRQAGQHPGRGQREDEEERGGSSLVRLLLFPPHQP